MKEVTFSQRAEADLLHIGRYTLAQWGPSQAVSYLTQLEDACQRLADLPSTGRACGQIRPGLRRAECGRHVIFYRLRDAGILVSRILHVRMMPEQHHMEDEPRLL